MEIKNGQKMKMGLHFPCRDIVLLPISDNLLACWIRSNLFSLFTSTGLLIELGIIQEYDRVDGEKSVNLSE